MRQITSWDASLSTEDTNVFLRKLALAHLAEVANSDENSYAWIIRNCFDRDDYRSLCELDLDYQRISGPLDAYNLRQALAFFQKRPDLDLGIDRSAVALAKFQEAEALCAETNHIFRQWSRGKFQFSPGVEGILHAAQRKIAKVLGDVPRLSELKPRFGPGATTAVKRKDANPRNKLGAGFQCSFELLPVVHECLAEMPGWWNHEDLPSRSDALGELVSLDVTPCHGKLAFVPKNAKTDRSIGVEPQLNTMFQLAIGDYMGARLAAFGVDLSDQTRNQRLARYGSFTGDLATLDLSSASDTIATELVAHLLPVDWFLFLSKMRTGTYEIGGSVIRLQKFSSMGNGFTFPLETLIFWALSSAACERWSKTDFFCTVYGDDIVVPSCVYEGLCEVLRCVGFIPNKAKSFASGPFRESCGKDYYAGIDIRPCYIKGPLTGQELFILHNYYVRTLQPDFAAFVLAAIHPVCRKWGPDGYGDGHLIGDWQPKAVHRESGYSGFTFETYIWKPKRDFKLSLPGDRVLPLYSIYARGPGGLRAEYTVSYDSSPGRLQAELRTAVHLAARLRDGGTAFSYDRRGRLGSVLPGRSECKVISIYTFSAQ